MRTRGGKELAAGELDLVSIWTRAPCNLNLERVASSQYSSCTGFTAHTINYAALDFEAAL